MLGGAGQKISTMVELAEDLYEKVNELRQRVESVSDTVEETGERVEAIEGELAEQRALIEALAEAQGVDVDAATAPLDEGESGDTDGGE